MYGLLSPAPDTRAPAPLWPLMYRAGLVISPAPTATDNRADTAVCRRLTPSHVTNPASSRPAGIFLGARPKSGVRAGLRNPHTRVPILRQRRPDARTLDTKSHRHNVVTQTGGPAEFLAGHSSAWSDRRGPILL
jgi:hypothetical protein